eukprot:1023977_1
MHPQASKNTSACYMNAVQREMKINELKETVKELKENLFQVRREIGELRETFAISYFESHQAKNDSFAVMVRFVLEHFEDVRKGIRWSIATREFADEIYSRGSGAYKTAHKSDALVLPSLSGVKARMLKYRHTDMTSVDWCDELRYELVFRYGSMEEARRNIFDVAMDEVGLGDDVHCNTTNFSLEILNDKRFSVILFI